jgi:hypothetical protein
VVQHGGDFRQSPLRQQETRTRDMGMNIYYYLHDRICSAPDRQCLADRIQHKRHRLQCMPQANSSDPDTASEQKYDYYFST